MIAPDKPARLINALPFAASFLLLPLVWYSAVHGGWIIPPVMNMIVDGSAEARFLVFPQAGDWLVQAVPVAGQPFSQRLPLPAAWAGLRGADLAALTGVGDAVFCHNGRFIGGAGSREGAIALARLALAAG